MSDTNKLDQLDRLPKPRNSKDYDLKTLKAKSNSLVAKALEAMEVFMDSDASAKDKAQMGFKIMQNHIVILDKVEKLEFVKLHKSNLVLKNNMMLQKSLNDDGSEYKKLVDTDFKPEVDLDIYGTFGEVDLNQALS